MESTKQGMEKSLRLFKVLSPFFYDIADLTLCGLCTITYIVHVDGYDTRKNECNYVFERLLRHHTGTLGKNQGMKFECNAIIVAKVNSKSSRNKKFSK